MSDTARYVMWAKPEALASAVGHLIREWGEYGYTITNVTGSPVHGGAIIEVWHSDGSIFFIGSDRYGNVADATTLSDLHALMTARVTS